MGVPADAPAGTKGDPNSQGNSRRWIIREVENSLDSGYVPPALADPFARRRRVS